MHWSTLLGPLPRSQHTEMSKWFAELSESTTGIQSCEMAIYGGRLAATPGLAFLAGYQAALRALVPSAPQGIGALCLTEQGSSKAADMQTRLLDGHITGRKDEADEQAPHLTAVLVATVNTGVTLQPGPRLAMLPDMPHSSVQFQQAQCQVLAGDGWNDYSKAFRTLEDAHVLAALCAWLYGQSLLDQWPQELKLQLLGVLAGLKETLQQPHTEAASHLLLAGLLAQFADLQAQITQALNAYSCQTTAQAWQRDKAILEIARSARMRRLEVAKNALGLI